MLSHFHFIHYSAFLNIIYSTSFSISVFFIPLLHSYSIFICLFPSSFFNSSSFIHLFYFPFLLYTFYFLSLSSFFRINLHLSSFPLASSFFIFFFILLVFFTLLFFLSCIFLHFFLHSSYCLYNVVLF